MSPLPRVRILAAALTLALTVGLMPTSAMASDNKTCTVPLLGPICAPATVVLDGKLLQQNKLGVQLGNPTLRKSLTDLLTQANAALTAGPWSVMDKNRIPPSG